MFSKHFSSLLFGASKFQESLDIFPKIKRCDAHRKNVNNQPLFLYTCITALCIKCNKRMNFTTSHIMTKYMVLEHIMVYMGVISVIV